MVEPYPKRPRLEVSAGKLDEKVDVKMFECPLEISAGKGGKQVKKFECPLCMSICEIMLPGNQRGRLEAICQNCKQWGRGKVLCFIVV